MKRLVSPKPGARRTLPEITGGPFIAEGDHVLAQDARAGAGAAHRDAVGVAHADQLRHRRAAEQRGEAQLIAAGEEDAARLLQALQAPGLLAIAARVEIHDGDLGGAQIRNNFS